MHFSFSVTDKNFRSLNARENYYILEIIIGGCIALILEYFTAWYIAIPALPIVTLLLINMKNAFNPFYKSEDIKGSLLFEDNAFHIKTDNAIVPIEILNKVTFDYTFTRFHFFLSGGRPANKIALLSLQTTEGESYNINMILSDYGQVKNLRKLLKKLYLKEIDVQEYYHGAGTRTLLLKQDWTFKDLKALKSAPSRAQV